MFEFLAVTQAGCRRLFPRHLLHRITTLALLAFAAFFFQTLYTPYSNAWSSEKPNIVLIMADDLGYHDLACYGHEQIKTPVLDQLSKDGLRLTSFYAGATVCTPSRMALLTGCYPVRLGWTRGVVGYMISTKHGLSPEAVTMAEVFKSAGYTTGVVGKWHLGDAQKFLPKEQGFDHSYYINKSNNQTKELWLGRQGEPDELVEKPFNNRLLSQQFTDEAVRFIRTHKAKPFLLYVPYTAPHFPVQAHPNWKDKSEYGVYGDVVEEMDHRIGEILEALNKEGLTKRTIVVFLSDNGPEPGTKASLAMPFRGRKWSALEGGTRVPCIIRWPERIPAGRESDALIAAIDLLPTLCAACNVDLAEATKGSLPIDGVDVLTTVLGQDDKPHARNELLYWHGADGFQAIRVGDWKLINSDKGGKLKGGGNPALFNLADDPGEATDLSEEHPERVETMQKLATQRLEELKANTIDLGN